MISLSSISANQTLLLKQSALSSLSAQQQRIMAVALVIFTCLSTLFLFSFCCCQTEKDLKVDKIEQKSFSLDNLKDLQKNLESKVLGQPYAIKVTVDALFRHAAGLRSLKSPIGTFLYVGPTGVGKTQLAKELTIQLLGSESHLIRMDMNEFTEEHSLTRLIGALPGYKQHEKGGQLTEALKKQPHSVVLLDEIDKAAPSVLKVFLQAFDEGCLSDAQGELVDCRNVIFILTSNIAASKILDLSDQGHTAEEILDQIKDKIIRALSPELYNRLVVAPFKGLEEDHIEQLIKTKLEEVAENLLEKKKIQLEFDQTVIDFIKDEGIDYDLGARPLNRLVEQHVTTSIAKKIIAGDIQEGDAIKVIYQKDEIDVIKVGTEHQEQESKID